MFGRYKETEDIPGWREKLADWRDAPLWVPQRPTWMTESPTALAFLFVALALGLLAVVYLATPPQSLPDAAPGYFNVAKAQAAAMQYTTTSSTTTTIAPEIRAKIRAEVQSWSPERRKAYLVKIAIGEQWKKEEAYGLSVLATPAQPATRRFDLALLLGAAAAGAAIVAWLASDARNRRQSGP